MNGRSRPEGRPQGVGTPFQSSPEVTERAAHASELASLALASGAVQICERCSLLLVPDVIMLQGIANGEDVPDTWWLQRGDGREVAVFALPEGWDR